MTAWQYSPYAVALVLGGLISLGITGYCLRYMRRHGRNYLVASVAVSTFANTIWNGAAMVKLLSTDLGVKLLFYQVELVVVSLYPAIMVVIAVAYVGWDRLITRRRLLVLLSVPLAAIGLVITNPDDVLITNARLVDFYGQVGFVHDFTPLFLLLVAWVATTVFVAGLIIGYGAFTNVVPTKPAALVILAVWLPLVISFVIFFGTDVDSTGLNVTQAGNNLAYLLLAAVIFRYRLFDLTPFGRSRAVDMMDDGYVLLNAAGVVVDTNAAADRLLADGGRTPITGHPFSGMLPAETQLGAASNVATFCIGDRDIEARHSEVTGRTVADGTVVVLRDVTVLKNRERELERQNTQLDRFASAVSHDLRNPLSVAKGYADLAAETGDERAFRVLGRAHDRMDAMIDELLTLARASTIVTDPEAVDVAAFARTVWETTDTDGVRFSTEITPDATVDADPTLLRHILENLFRNAADHNERPLTVSVGLLTDDDTTIGIYVEDDGTGISAEARETIFEHGYTTDKDGTGFGLSIVKAFVDAHGWEILVTEGTSGGARFEIRTV